MYIGQTIKQKRLENGLTKGHLANMIGMSRKRLSQIERPHEGDEPPTISEIVLISTGLGVSTEKINALLPEPPKPRPRIEDFAFICGAHGCMSGQQLKALQNEGEKP